MNISTRRIAAGFALAAAPALIALGAAATSSAQTTIPSASVVNTMPTAGDHAFHGQQNFPQPGSTVHHHHQMNRR
jgi:hypothetical protein